MAYNPNPTPPRVGDLELLSIVRYAQDEFLKIAQSQNITPVLVLETSSEPPERVIDGMVVYADGVGWDPGSGSGIYAYVNGSWQKL